MFTLLLGSLAALVVAVVGERLYALAYRLPLSAELMTFALGQLRAGASLAELARERPHSHAARLIAAHAGMADGDTVDDVLGELRAEAGQRLMLLRTLATLASTLGLLTGISALVEGFAAEDAGLYALEAGLPQKMAVGLALRGMAIGVATSALCFFALGRLRPLARTLVAQDERLARALLGL